MGRIPRIEAEMMQNLDPSVTRRDRALLAQATALARSRCSASRQGICEHTGSLCVVTSSPYSTLKGRPLCKWFAGAVLPADRSLQAR